MTNPTPSPRTPRQISEDIATRLRDAVAIVRRVHPEVATPSVVITLQRLCQDLADIAIDSHARLAEITERLESIEQELSDGRRSARRSDSGGDSEIR